VGEVLVSGAMGWSGWVEVDKIRYNRVDGSGYF
jgi:hypothetical protein